MRHGEPKLAGRLLGHTDCAVLPAGIAACRAAAAGVKVDRVVTSDLRRAADCGVAIATDLSVPLHVDARWRELDFGQWDGLATADVDAAALGRFWDDPDAAPPPAGERWSALLARVAGALDAIDGPTLVVSHAGAIRAALVAACGFDRRQGWAFDLPYGSVLSLRLWRGDAPAAQITGLRA
ncbi:histidine phosphatase family protein [Sphingomonas sp. ac-8]|uniref:histidine phosphatase family protein n=1 Tax=Sphingomonas sp. ac-8 TaxID=3242977 RepID=UPI003A7FB0FA